MTTPDCAVAGSTEAIGQAVPVEDGLRISGTWGFTSGIDAAVRVMALCDAFLEPNYLLTGSLAICIHPGESAQPIHTDDGF